MLNFHEERDKMRRNDCTFASIHLRRTGYVNDQSSMTLCKNSSFFNIHFDRHLQLFQDDFAKPLSMFIYIFARLTIVDLLYAFKICPCSKNRQYESGIRKFSIITDENNILSNSAYLKNCPDSP